MVASIFGVSFLTPLAALFGLAVVVPLGAFFVTERRAQQVRRVLRVAVGPRALWPVVLALVLLPMLVAVAAAQPVVIRPESVSQRDDAQAFVLFDTSLSMQAAAGPHDADRLARAKGLATRLERSLADVPFGIATMTDRSLPELMPTVDQTVFERTVEQAVAINSPPPSQPHQGRATTFDALAPLVQSNFYSQGVQRRLLVVFTDGESAKISPLLKLELQRRVAPVYVHVWQAGEHIYKPGGKVDRRYSSDPTSGPQLDQMAKLTSGRVFSEHDFGGIAKAARAAVGRAQSHSEVSSYARVPLAPWFILAAIAPLAFLLWRRNL
jgi:hypothetical protein